MQDRFIELTRRDGTPLTLNVAHITAIGYEEKATKIVGGVTTESRVEAWVTTTARQHFAVLDSYDHIKGIVQRAHL